VKDQRRLLCTSQTEGKGGGGKSPGSDKLLLTAIGKVQTGNEAGERKKVPVVQCMDCTGTSRE